MLRLSSFFVLITVCSVGLAQTADKAEKKFPPKELFKLAKLSTEEFMKRFDKNMDGFLSMDELPPFLAKGFSKADANGDGKLDRKEVAVLQQNIRQMLAQPFPKRNPDMIVDDLLKQFDANKDGKISKDEARGKLADNFAKLDRNGDGFLDRTELRAFAERIMAFGQGPPGAKGGNRPDFDALDRNADGRLSREELKGTPWEARFADIDTNGDGQIDRREFETFLRQQGEKKEAEKK